MQLRRPAFLVVLALLGLAFAACGSVAPYAATVDGKRIDQNALEDELRFIASNERYLASIEARAPVRGAGQGTFDAAFTAQVLTRQIYYVIIDREIDNRDLEVTDKDLADARATVIEQLEGEEVLAAFPRGYQDTVIYRTAALNVLALGLNGQNSDAAARAYYDAHAADFLEACVSHILLASQERAVEVRARLDAGEDFAVLAATESEDSGSASRNGELRCGVTRELSYPPQFLDNVFGLPINQVSQPLQTDLGWHLLKVTSRASPPFEQVEAKVRAAMILEADALVTDFLREAVTKADIKVDPRYGTFDQGRAQVIPPGAPNTSTPAPTAPAQPAPAPAPTPTAATATPPPPTPTQP